MTERGRTKRRHSLLALCLFYTTIAGCGATPPTTSMPIDAERLRSVVLHQNWRCLEDAVANLRGVAPGMHPLVPAEPEHGLEGRTYEHSFHRLVTGPVGAALYRLVFDELRPEPTDASFYVTITFSAVDGAMLDDESPPPVEEVAAQRRFFAQLQRCTRGQSLVYTVHAGWADAVGGRHDGYLIVDADNSEALWIRLEESWAP